MLHEYHVIYSVRYYLWFHVTAVGIGTYYPWIREHYCTDSEVMNHQVAGVVAGDKGSTGYGALRVLTAPYLLHLAS
jgi:hypothetical protein